MCSILQGHGVGAPYGPHCIHRNLGPPTEKETANNNPPSQEIIVSSHDNRSSYLEARRNQIYARRSRIHDISTRIDQLRNAPFVGVKEIDENIDLEIEQLVKVRDALRRPDSN